jgi:hypothetical protein
VELDGGLAESKKNCLLTKTKSNDPKVYKTFGACFSCIGVLLLVYE